MDLEFKGTKGQWILDGRNIKVKTNITESGEMQIVNCINSINEERLANAKLIATAPDLLKTLDYINNELTKFHQQDNYSLNTNYLLKISTEAIEKALK